MFLPWPVVVDADVLYRNIDFAVRWGNPGALLGQASPSYSLIGGVVLFAATEVCDEAVRHMPDIARRRGVSLDVVDKAWRELILPSVRFTRHVDILSTLGLDEEVVAGEIDGDEVGPHSINRIQHGFC